MQLEHTANPPSLSTVQMIPGDIHSESSIFAALEAPLDARYLETERHLEESGLAANKTTFEDVRPVTNIHDAVSYLGFTSSRILPFPFDIVSEGSWRVSHAARIELPHGAYETCGHSDNVIKAKILMALPVRSTLVNATTWFFTKRYIESQREIYVWNLWSVANGGVLNSHTIQVVEDGWTAIEPVPGTDYSIVQVFARLHANQATMYSSVYHETIGVVTDIILAMFCRNMGSVFEALNMSLVDKAVANRV